MTLSVPVLLPLESDFQICAIDSGGKGVKVRKTAEQRIEELRRQREQLDARLARLAAKQKSQARKRDARRKIIVGAAVLAHAEVDPGFRDALRAALRAGVTREIDREVVQDLIGG